jgi:poly(3-hydroxybutyrate) depolymerase
MRAHVDGTVPSSRAPRPPPPDSAPAVQAPNLLGIPPRWAAHLIAATLALSAPIGAAAQTVDDPGTAPLERCLQRGWSRLSIDIDGTARTLLWRGPSGPWARGVILVAHGGGGQAAHWCAGAEWFAGAQIRFADAAVAEGFAVFALESTDRVTDVAGRVCGKVWDDEPRDRPNLDLPYLSAIIDRLVPSLRPPDSARAVFMTGLSSGAFMTVRAATHLGERLAAAAPVSGGDPYGWRRECIAGLTPRRTVNGIGRAIATGRPISEPEACGAPDAPAPTSTPRWDEPAGRKPPMRVFLHREDGIHDASCAHALAARLRRQGYPLEADVELVGGRRSLASHLWLDAYTPIVLEFFARHAR